MTTTRLPSAARLRILVALTITSAVAASAMAVLGILSLSHV